MRIAAFWIMTMCSLMDTTFRRTYCP